MSASVEDMKAANVYQPFRDRDGFPPFSEILRRKAEQDINSPLFNFERDLQLSALGVRNESEQKEMDDIARLRKFNQKDQNVQRSLDDTLKKLQESQTKIDELNLKRGQLTEQESKTLQAETEKRKQLEQDRENLRPLDEELVQERQQRKERTDQLLNVVNAFATAFPIPQDFVYQVRKLEDGPILGERKLVGQELEEYKFLYQLQVMDLCLMNPRFKELVSKPAGELSYQEKQEVEKYHQDLLLRTERAKRAFDFTCEGNHKVGWPTVAKEQYFNAVQLVSAIDLTKPVNIGRLEKGKFLQQRQQEKEHGKDLWIGNYFKDALSKATAAETGIASITTASIINAFRRGNKSSKKVTFTYETTEDVDVLLSSARAAADTWSIPGKVIMTTGGGEQIFLPVHKDDKKRLFKEISHLEFYTEMTTRIERQIEAVSQKMAATSQPEELKKLEQEKSNLEEDIVRFTKEKEDAQKSIDHVVDTAVRKLQSAFRKHLNEKKEKPEQKHAVKSHPTPVKVEPTKSAVHAAEPVIHFKKHEQELPLDKTKEKINSILSKEIVRLTEKYLHAKRPNPLKIKIANKQIQNIIKFQTGQLSDPSATPETLQQGLIHLKKEMKSSKHGFGLFVKSKSAIDHAIHALRHDYHGLKEQSKLEKLFRINKS